MCHVPTHASSEDRLAKVIGQYQSDEFSPVTTVTYSLPLGSALQRVEMGLSSPYYKYGWPKVGHEESLCHLAQSNGVALL